MTAGDLPASCDPIRSLAGNQHEMRDSATEFTDRTGAFTDAEAQILDTVESNSLMLQDMLEQVAEMRDVVAAQLQPPPVGDDQDPSRPSADEMTEASEQLCRELRSRILELEDEVGYLKQQNGDLASQVASQTVQQTVQQDASGTLTWEERKQLILQQMEQDSFNADQFVSSLQEERQQLAEQDPANLLDDLKNELDQHADELSRRDEEIRELRHLLEQQSGTQGGVAIGAAAIAQAMDDDELVRQERERLQQLQQDWEEKFRQSEIQMSLERAQLSRERQELATKQQELELQVEQFAREAKYTDANGAQPARKWLAKLGLNES